MSKVVYAFLNNDRTVYPEGSSLRDFLEDDKNVFIYYPYDDLIKKEESEQADDVDEKLFSHSNIYVLMEWTAQYDESWTEEQAREYLNSIGFEENQIIIENIDDIPIG